VFTRRRHPPILLCALLFPLCHECQLHCPRLPSPVANLTPFL
jgi:hypothetical protein